MSRIVPKDNGYALKNICGICDWIGTTDHVCPSCGHYYETMGRCVVKWVSTYRWYHYLGLIVGHWGNNGHWEKKK
jgi:hypothetical protein